MENINKLTAVVRIKWLIISRNAAIVMSPVMVMGMVWGFKILYGHNTGGELSPVLVSMILSLGITMNICSNGFVVVGTAVAEEKEKHTLRVLMTSSVTGIQYFIGSIIFPFLLLMITNFLVLWVSGVSFSRISVPAFFIISVIASLTSCVIGMIVGIYAKNQMSANLLSYPLMMVLMMVPILGNMSETLHKISGVLFTGVMTEMTDCFANGEQYSAKPLSITVLAGEFIISVLVFLMLYRRNGYEKD